jgi:hypothetical protein
MEENRKWQAKWIWLDKEAASGTKQERAYARRTFRIADPGNVRLTIDVTADSRYRLYMNGDWVSSGPSKGDGWSHYYETLDLSAYLVPGVNVLAAIVVHYPIVSSGNNGENGPVSVWRSDRGGFLLEGSVTDEHGTVLETLHTDNRWRMQRDDAVSIGEEKLTLFVGGMETVDAARLPHGWRFPSFDDTSWMPPGQLQEPYDPLWGGLNRRQLTPRTIPPLRETERFPSRLMRSDRDPDCAVSRVERLFPYAIAARTEGWLELDIGEMTAGYPELRLIGGAKAVIKLLYSEAYEYAASHAGQGGSRRAMRDDPTGKVLVGNEDAYIAAGFGSEEQPEIYEPLAVRAGRFIRLSYTTADEPLTIIELIWREEGYPLESVAKAESSDPDWPLMWEISLNTLRRCMHDTYEDTPFYEQMQYTMDARSQALFTYQISADDRLPRKTIHDYHSSLLPSGMLQSRYPSVDPQIIPGFSLIWVLMVHDHYRYFGDLSLVRRYRPTIDAVLDWFGRRVENGLVGIIPEAYWSFVDWVEEWRDKAGSPPAKWLGPMTVYNLMYAAALACAAELNEATGRGDTAKEYAARADEIREAARSRCFDEELGLYRDGPDVCEFSQHAQIWAVLGGAATGRAAIRLMERTLSDATLPRASFSMSFFYFRALSITGLYDRTLELWKPWKDQIGLHLTAWVEDPVTQRSDCHGWGALPLYEYTAETLGVQPAEPGFARIRIAPQLSGLTWASGTVATPKGTVDVGWSLSEERMFRLSVHSPAGVPTLIVLPNGESRESDEGGKLEARCKLD